MAQYNTGRNTLLTNGDKVFEVMMLADKQGNINDSDNPIITTVVNAVDVIQVQSSVSAFEEPLAAQIYPEIQIDAIYGLPEDTVYKREIGTATAGAADGMFFATSGTTSGSAGLVASFRLAAIPRLGGKVI